MAVLQTLTNSVIQQAIAYFQNNIGLYPTRSDVASVLPGKIAANGEQLAFARNVINNMSPNSFCVPSSNGMVIDLCDALIPKTGPQGPVVARFFEAGSVTIDDIWPSCMADDDNVPGCECNFSITCNGALGLSGTLYYLSNGTIGDNCSCGAA